MLYQLSAAELAEISEENGWFFFSVVRHPFDRLWSAWQSKLLLREPPFVNRYPSAPWPRMPVQSSDIVEDFQHFAKALAGGADDPLFKDRHFLPQAELLNLGGVPYSRIYRTTEIRSLLEDLEGHLRPLGLETMPELVRHNETPLAPIAPLFDDATTTAVSEYYAADMKAFDFSGVSSKELVDRHYSSEEITFLRSVIERAERALDLYTFASEHFHRQRQATEESVKLQARVEELEAEIQGRERGSRSPGRFGWLRKLMSLAGARRRD